MRHTRWMAGLLVAALVTALVAPAAQADRRHRRYKGPRYRTEFVHRNHHHGPGSVYVVRRSSTGPAIAGFLGGLFLGATLAHAAPDGYAYYDPYCEEHFVSLEVYRTHLHRHHHPRVVRVIERDTDHCVETYHYDDGGWRKWRDHDRDWDDD